jgi:hypothetical protein
VAYAKERVVFGRPIGQNQAVAFPLAEIHARLRAAEMMIRRAAWLIDRRMPCGEEANLAKYLAAEAGFAAADHAVQVHGGFGYAEEYHVARYWREARLMKIAPITQELVLAYVTDPYRGSDRSGGVVRPAPRPEPGDAADQEGPEAQPGQPQRRTAAAVVLHVAGLVERRGGVVRRYLVGRARRAAVG